MFGVRLLIFIALALGLLRLPDAVADEPAAVNVEALYEELFGADDRTVAATSDFADDLALADRVLAACRQLAEPQALREYLCERAYRLTWRRNEGLNTAVAAMGLLMELAPARADDTQQRIVDLYTQASRRGRADDRTAAAASLIDCCMKFGDQQFLDRRYAEAVQMYQRGSATARSIRSDQRDAIELRSNCANAMFSAATRIARAAERLADADNPRALNSQLARACLQDLADFDSAAWYAQSADDAELAKMIHLARRRPERLDADQLMQVGDWLVAMAADAGEYPRSQLLRRAMRMYSTYLEQPNLDEVHRLLADTRLAAAKRQLDQLNVPHMTRRD